MRVVEEERRSWIEREEIEEVEREGERDDVRKKDEREGDTKRAGFDREVSD